MAILIIGVGKLKEAWQRDACAEYMKRMKRFGPIEIKEIPDQPEPDKPSEVLNQRVKDAEGKEILAQIKPTDRVVALAINGKTYDSEGFAEKIAQWTGDGHRLVLIIGGSLPESEKGNIYNTCFVYGPDGKLLARHRKVHLFDIDIPGGQYFKESDTLTAGEYITVFDSPYGRFGIGICFDIRFAELARSMALKGANVLFYPGAFNHTTGPAHWELLLRARAVDDQLFVVGTAPANNRDASYHSYGHSMIVDPWGKIVDSLGEEEAILYAEIDFDEAKAIRERLPVMSGLRRDVYPVDPIK